MADRHTIEQRRYNMQRIKSADTKPEIFLRKKLFSLGFRYRVNFKKLPGKPDIVLSKYKTIIFINGCFWHGHESCKFFKIPKTRTDFWVDKIEKNKLRDFKNTEELLKEGWNVITIWECDLKRNKFESTLEKLVIQIKNNF